MPGARRTHRPSLEVQPGRSARLGSRRFVLGPIVAFAAALALSFASTGSSAAAAGQATGSVSQGSAPGPVTWEPLAISMAPGSSSRVPNPKTGLLPDGRQLHPRGSQVTLGDLPMGAALTADGRFLWAVDAGLGNDDVQIIDTTTDRVCQILPLPGASGGIVLDSRHHLAYVSGLPQSL